MVVDYLISRGYEVMQLGIAGEMLVPKTIDLRGKTTIREASVVIKRARLLIACNSFSQQLAHGNLVPTLVLYGSTCPKDSCHDEQHFIFKPVGCNPCWKREPCDSRKCMGEITTGEVIREIEVLLMMKCDDPIKQDNAFIGQEEYHGEQERV